MKTSTLPPPEQQWYLVDASGKSLGRLASRIAFVIRGKHHPSWSPHHSFRDHVVVVNASAAEVGKTTRHTKVYRHHTGYVGALRTVSAALLLSRAPEKVLERSIRGMLPANRLRDGALKRLHIYRGSDHPHTTHNFLPLPLV